MARKRKEADGVVSRCIICGYVTGEFGGEPVRTAYGLCYNCQRQQKFRQGIIERYCPSCHVYFEITVSLPPDDLDVGAWLYQCDLCPSCHNLLETDFEDMTTDGYEGRGENE